MGRQRQAGKNRRVPFKVEHGHRVPAYPTAIITAGVKFAALSAGQLAVDIGDTAKQAQVWPQFAKSIQLKAAITLFAIDTESISCCIGNSAWTFDLEYPGRQTKANPDQTSHRTRPALFQMEEIVPLH